MSAFPPAYADLVCLTADNEPAHTVWHASDLPKLTLDQITLVRDARGLEFGDHFAEADLDASDLLDALTKPPLILQATILNALEWAARQVLFDDALAECARRDELRMLEECDERGEQAYQRSKSEQLDGVKS